MARLATSGFTLYAAHGSSVVTMHKLLSASTTTSSSSLSPRHQRDGDRYELLFFDAATPLRPRFTLVRLLSLSVPSLCLCG